MATNKSVRHHFIPQFYLKGFVEPQDVPFLWVYRKDTGAIIKSSVKDTAVHKHYYSFKSKPLGTRDSQTIEKWFNNLETSVSMVFKKILNKQELNNNERSDFTSFLALTLTRVPNYRENMINNPTAQLIKRMEIIKASHKQHYEARIKQYEENTGNKITVPVEKLRQHVLKGNYDVKIANPDYSLNFMFKIARDVAPVFHAMNWAFFETTDEEYFLTCDNPLYYMDPTYKSGSFYGVGLMNKKLEVTFPLSKNLALLATWGDLKGYHIATSKIRNTLNRRTIISAQNFVFSPVKSTDLGMLISKFKGSSPRIKVS